MAYDSAVVPMRSAGGDRLGGMPPYYCVASDALNFTTAIRVVGT